MGDYALVEKVIEERIAAAVAAERQKWQEAVRIAEATMRAAVRSSDKTHEAALTAVEAERKACEEIARNGMLVPPDGGSPNKDEIDTANRIANAIAARGTAKKAVASQTTPSP